MQRATGFWFGRRGRVGAKEDRWLGRFMIERGSPAAKRAPSPASRRGVLEQLLPGRRGHSLSSTDRHENRVATGRICSITASPSLNFGCRARGLKYEGQAGDFLDFPCLVQLSYPFRLIPDRFSFSISSSRQFSEGFSARSTTIISALADSSFNPNCSWTAVKRALGVSPG